MLKPLTSLRFIFALMVLGSHLSVLRNSEVLCEQWLFQNILREGFIGVSFFFILSGFILSYRYQDSLTTKRESKRQFYVARIARIYPLHLLTFLAAIPFVIIKLQPTTSAWLKNGVLNLSLTHSLFIDKNTYFSFNSPSWSISTEMFFYLLFPVLIPILSKVKTRSKQLITILIMGTTLLIAIYLTPQKLHHAFFYISPCFRIFDFMMGIMLYNIFLSIKRQKVSLNSWHELLGIVLLAIFFIFHHKIDPVFRYSIYYWLPMAVIIIIFATSSGRISKLLSSKALIKLGEASFALYMLHHLMFRYFTNCEFLSSIQNNYVKAILYTTLTILMSIIVHKWIEQPMNRFAKKILHY